MSENFDNDMNQNKEFEPSAPEGGSYSEYPGIVSSEVEERISFSDRLVGILTEPSVIFEKMSKAKASTGTWLIPLLLVFTMYAIANIVISLNPNSALDQRETARAGMERRIEKMKADGKISKEQAEQQREMFEKQIDAPKSMMLGISTVAIFVTGMLFTFFVCLIYYLMIKFVMKGNIDYQGILIVQATAGMVSLISLPVIIALAFVTGKHFMDLSVATLLRVFTGTELQGMALLVGRIDIVTIWATVITGFGFAKYNNSDTKKYMGFAFGMYIAAMLIGHVFYMFFRSLGWA